MGTPCFNPVQKSFMMLTLASCSLDRNHLLEAITLVSSQVVEQISQVHFESEWSSLRC